jgi:hypothetical protein
MRTGKGKSIVFKFLRIEIMNQFKFNFFKLIPLLDTFLKDENQTLL